MIDCKFHSVGKIQLISHVKGAAHKIFEGMPFLSDHKNTLSPNSHYFILDLRLRVVTDYFQSWNTVLRIKYLWPFISDLASGLLKKKMLKFNKERVLFLMKILISWHWIIFELAYLQWILCSKSTIIKMNLNYIICYWASKIIQ